MVGCVVRQITILGAAPHRLDRIEIRSISRQPLDGQPTRTLFSQQANRLAMHVETIQDDDQVFPQHAMKPTQELDDIGGHDVVVVEPPIGMDTSALG